MPFGAIASVVGSAIGARNTKKTNETNLKINQMNNEFNERMLDKQNQFNLEQWNREVSYNDRVRDETNLYNSAREQVERYREAGLNPIMMMQGQGAGTSMGGTAPSTSSGSASAASPIGMQSYTPNIDVSGLSNTILGFWRTKNEVKQQQEITKGLEIDNQYKEAQLLKQLENLGEDVRGKKYDNNMKAIEEASFQRVMNANVRTAEGQADQIDLDRQLKEADIVYKNLVNKQLPAELAAKVASMIAQTDYHRFMSRDNVVNAADNIINEIEKGLDFNLPDKYKKIIFDLIKFKK